MILVKRSTDGLDDITFTEEKKFKDFPDQQKKFCLSFHFNGTNSYIFVNCVKIYKFKTKDSENVQLHFRLGNVSKDFSVDNMGKTGLCKYVYDLLVVYDSINVDDILDIQWKNYLMKKIQYEIMFGFLNMFISRHTTMPN